MSVTYDDSVGVEVSSDSFWEVMPRPFPHDAEIRLVPAYQDCVWGVGWGDEHTPKPARHLWSDLDGNRMAKLSVKLPC